MNVDILMSETTCETCSGPISLALWDEVWGERRWNKKSNRAIEEATAYLVYTTNIHPENATDGLCSVT
jgi:hypothetical protein